ncbi:hypothetical protein [Noviherbaspirillum galbum]|uniref:Uncharacterized protein n=1 Tax=Noviherbaspirillum galbum TaxID=2709383 RepID=A0A6B3SVS6_9BURK|nr:hypothetical protein [Noviherbaspirillum galbum]NEX62482.1 hypothetical protein [Noviherbaspirillum galbum]
MQDYLSHSIASLNQNKLYGLLAEVEFRAYLTGLGYGGQVSVGGWVARSTSNGANRFGQNTIVIFPEIIQPGNVYLPGGVLPSPPAGLHTICAAFHSIGIQSYYLYPQITRLNDSSSISWTATQLGLLTAPQTAFPSSTLTGFLPRARRYNFLKNNTSVSSIPHHAVPDEFSKEHARVALQSAFMTEISDVDGVFWGRQHTYPVEIKEKTAAYDKKIGHYFGLDHSPFVKLTFFAAMKGMMKSIFVVREIDNTTTRDLVQWWFITFEDMARYASWSPRGGGRNMGGGTSSTVMIPKDYFLPLNAKNLATL